MHLQIGIDSRYVKRNSYFCSADCTSVVWIGRKHIYRNGVYTLVLIGLSKARNQKKINSCNKQASCDATLDMP